jgi:uncharacterized membrane protein
MEISPKRLIIALVLIFFLGILFSVINGFYVQQEGSSLPLLVYGISFISLILGAFLVILFQWKINKIQIRRVVRILPAPERKLVSLLLENGNALEQNRLVALSGFNKVKMSRLIHELEMRDVIAKKNLGNTNLVTLKI